MVKKRINKEKNKLGTFKPHRLPEDKRLEPLEKWKYIPPKIAWWNIYRKYKRMEFETNPDKQVKVNMEMSNGKHRSFRVIEKDGGFVYRDKMYLFDVLSKYYNIDDEMFCYDFHEDITVPIKRIFPSDDIISTFENSGVTEIEYAINPKTIRRFQVSKLAEGIMRGQSIDSFMTKQLVLSIIILMVLFITFIISIYNTGILDKFIK